MAKRIIILGATSAIALAAARMWAARGDKLLLVARQKERLEIVAGDLKARGAEVDTQVMDMAKANVSKEWPKMMDAMGGVDIVLLAYGYLPDDNSSKTDLKVAAEVMDTNLSSATQWSLAAAQTMHERDHGVLLLVSSVAGDRGRQGNIVYNASKAGLSTLGQGLAHWMATGNARCVVIKPGTTVTPMTAHMGKRKGLMWATAERVAKDIVKAGDKGTGPLGSSVVYAPWFWRGVMLIIQNVPTFVLHKTKL